MDETQGSGELEFVNRPVNRKAASALSLKAMGASLEEICRVVGFASPKEAGNAIDKALREEFQSDPKAKSKARDMAGRRFEGLLRSVSTKANNPKDPEHLAAVGRAADIVSRLVKLYGLDAPTEMVVHSPDASELERWVMAALQQAEPPLEEFDILDGEIVEDDEDPGDGVLARVGA